MTPIPELKTPLAKRLLDLHDRLGKRAARGMQTYLEWAARRRERRERRFAKQGWIWLACMIVLLVIMVLNQREHPEMMYSLAELVAFGLLGYLLTLVAQRRVAARDKASRKDEIRNQ